MGKLMQNLFEMLSLWTVLFGPHTGAGVPARVDQPSIWCDNCPSLVTTFMDMIRYYVAVDSQEA